MENTERSQKSKDVLLTMVGLLGLKAEISEKVSGKNIILSVSTDEPGRLIGRNGSSLDSVGLLMNRILKKNDLEFPKVIIDVDGYDKKSKRDRDRKKGRRNDKSRSMNKTTVLNETPESKKPEAAATATTTTTAPADGEINFYVDNDSQELAPVTTVALNKGSSNDGRGRNNNNRNRNNNKNRNNNNRNRNNNNQRQDRTTVVDKSNHPEGENLKPNPLAAERNTSVNAPVKTPESKAPESNASVNAPVKAPESKAPESNASVNAPVKAPENKAPESNNRNKNSGSQSANRIQMQCRNTLKEVKRWGEEALMPPMSEADSNKAIEYLNNEKGVKAAVDLSKSNGDKKRVRVSLNN